MSENPGARVEPVCAATWVASWSDALRTVELDVDRAEELIRRMHRDPGFTPEPPGADEWVSPDLEGPVPEQFAARARRLLQRQIEVSAQLGEAMGQARSQRSALEKLEQAERRPVFLDTAV
ncbi:hypothetical protein AB2L28_15850 [Kineococcus sp. TBRC 1896]|uniref:Uncharacterized protein n=1 Tax=Kineococcus mangrovi TaxID=1660183 RepID=A0ABV4I4U1_9ACTN